MPGFFLTATKFGRHGMKPIPGGQSVQCGQMGQLVTRYKRVASGKSFTVDYPAAYWNGLTVQEQLEIVNFYNSTYGKKKATAAKTTRQIERPRGAIHGHNHAGG